MALAATDPAHCLARRTGWALHDAMPPTLPDRQRSDGLLLPAGRCADGRAHAAVARWPVALEPFVSDAARRSAAPCPGVDAGAATALRIAGLDDGAVLRAAPGQRRVEIRLAAQGQPTPADVYWLVDGEQRRRTRGTEPWRLRLEQPGRHAITAFDAAGRHHRIVVTLAGT
jgi:penicillin-binding protein 1C